MKQELNFRIQDHNIAILFVQQATLRTLPDTRKPPIWNLDRYFLGTLYSKAILSKRINDLSIMRCPPLATFEAPRRHNYWSDYQESNISADKRSDVQPDTHYL